MTISTTTVGLNTGLVTFGVDDVGDYQINQRIRFNANDDRFYNTVTNAIAFPNLSGGSPRRSQENPYDDPYSHGSIEFNNTSTVLGTRPNAALNAAVPWTTEIYVYIEELPSARSILSHTRYQVYFDTARSGTTNFFKCWFTYNGVSYQSVAPQFVWSFNLWIKVSISQDEYGSVTLYINDIPVLSKSNLAIAAITTSTAHELYVGSFKGRFYGLRHYPNGGPVTFETAIQPLEYITLNGNSFGDYYLAYLEGFITGINRTGNKSITVFVDVVRGLGKRSAPNYRYWTATNADPVYEPGYIPLAPSYDESTIHMRMHESTLTESTTQTKSITTAEAEMYTLLQTELDDTRETAVKRVYVVVDDTAQINTGSSEGLGIGVTTDSKNYVISADY